MPESGVVDAAIEWDLAMRNFFLALIAATGLWFLGLARLCLLLALAAPTGSWISEVQWTVLFHLVLARVASTVLRTLVQVRALLLLLTWVEVLIPRGTALI